MGIAVLVIMGTVAAFGVFSFLALSRSGRPHQRRGRGARGYDGAQVGALWDGGWGGSDGGGSSCGDGGGGGGGGGGSC